MDIEEKLKAIQDKKGNNLYEHLLNTIGKMVQDHPNNAYEMFEEFSHFVKQNDYKYNDTKNYLTSSRIREKYPEIKEHLESMSTYFGFEKLVTDEDGGEPPEANPIGYVSDMMKEERMFKQIGVGFGEVETYKIFTSLKKFCALKQATQVKFWGKINGSVKDYYVIEAAGVETGGEDEDIPEPHEPKGTGINVKQYFVNTNIMDENGWIELPLLMPRHITQARKIRHLFTGNLNHVINSSPAFQGTEREYLRAQIARISHATSLTHKGLFVVKTEDDGGDPNLQEVEPFEFEEDSPIQPLTGEALSKVENWVHQDASILQEGRLIHLEIEEDDDDKKTLLMAQKVALDPFESRLKLISQDKYLDLPTCWILRTHGEFSKSRHQYKNEMIHDTLVSLRSLVWPGMYYIAKDKFFTSIYIGDGHKYTLTDYFPLFPYLINMEPVDRQEDVEPNPPGCENDPDEEGEGEGEGEYEGEGADSGDEE